MEDSPDSIDLGQLLLSGKSPFPVVESRVRALAPGESLLLRAPFEPLPLYAFLETWGAAFEVERQADGGVSIGVTKSAPEPVVPRYLDLRRLPQAKVADAVVEAYRALASGHCLIVHLADSFERLTPELDERGIVWENQVQSDGTFHIYMLKDGPPAPSCALS